MPLTANKPVTACVIDPITYRGTENIADQSGGSGQYTINHLRARQCDGSDEATHTGNEVVNYRSQRPGTGGCALAIWPPANAKPATPTGSAANMFLLDFFNARRE